MGRNFVDPIPLDDCPAIVETRKSLAEASLTSKFQTTTMFPGVSSIVLDVYVEYVPHLVPRAPRSVVKRGRADCSSSGLPATKKSRQSSTRLGTQAIGSVLLGEHINMLSFCCLFVPLTEYFSPFSDGAVAALLETEDDDAPLVTRR